ncbi:Uncharacterized protein APZ42_023726 [Daphnia magna]|uniref:Uncharacterized protein n=1 Tax=Daphnia magna TaxID=35525 RepID=A0A164UQ06_9CRUS|nr:Uncharacterized protein APZ42_023726 [Daphnia magna]
MVVCVPHKRLRDHGEKYATFNETESLPTPPRPPLETTLLHQGRELVNIVVTFVEPLSLHFLCVCVFIYKVEG